MNWEQLLANLSEIWMSFVSANKSEIKILPLLLADRQLYWLSMFRKQRNSLPISGHIRANHSLRYRLILLLLLLLARWRVFQLQIIVLVRVHRCRRGSGRLQLIDRRIGLRIHERFGYGAGIRYGAHGPSVTRDHAPGRFDHRGFLLLLLQLLMMIDGRALAGLKGLLPFVFHLALDREIFLHRFRETISLRRKKFPKTLQL